MLLRVSQNTCLGAKAQVSGALGSYAPSLTCSACNLSISAAHIEFLSCEYVASKPILYLSARLPDARPALGIGSARPESICSRAFAPHIMCKRTFPRSSVHHNERLLTQNKPCTALPICAWLCARAFACGRGIVRCGVGQTG